MQFDEKYVFNMHLSLVHGKKIELMIEENHQMPKTSEQVFSEDHVVDTRLKCGTCDSLFKTKQFSNATFVIGVLLQNKAWTDM